MSGGGEMSKKYIFDIDFPTDTRSSTIGVTDTIIIEVVSGEIGRDDGTFEQLMVDTLMDWYEVMDGVSLRKEEAK